MAATEEPRVSVIIPAYNAVRTLGRQLEALARQIDAPTFEVLVVDNRSSDRPGDVVARYSDRLDIRLIPAMAHQGVSYARNVGIGEARADHLMFCDADDVAGPRWIAYGFKTFEVTPLWSGSVKTLSDSQIDLPLDQVWELLGEDGPWTPPVYEQATNAFPVLQGGDFGVTREVMQRLGGFDQSLPTRGEDNELALRARHHLGLEVPVSKSVRNCGGTHEGQQERIARADAKAHALLAAKFNLWQQSPFKRWPEEWLRCAAAGLRMVFQPHRRDWEEWRLRLARTIGFTEGSIEFGLLGRVPQPAIGVGWRRRVVTSPLLDDDGRAPVASVIIPAYNAEKWIGEQLESLASQVDAPPFEVVIGDNGSTDATAEVATERAWPFPVRVVDASGYQSASFARNVAADAADTEMLLFCDADDLVSPYWVKTLVDALQESGGALVSGAIHHERFNDSDVLHAYGISPDRMSDEVASMPLMEEPGGYAGHLPTVPGGSFAAVKSVYFAQGGMDPSYPGGAEETDFAWRLQEDEGVRVVSAPRAFIEYRLKNSPRALFRQQRIQQRGRVLLWTRNRHTPMQGPSWKASISALVKLLVLLPRSRGSRRDVLAWAQEAGAHVGALEGMIKYRLLRHNPSVVDWGTSNAGN